MDKEESSTSTKGRHGGPVLYLDISVAISRLCRYAIVLQDITCGGNWVKGTWDLSVLFLPTVGESTIISKLKF